MPRFVELISVSVGRGGPAFSATQFALGVPLLRSPRRSSADVGRPCEEHCFSEDSEAAARFGLRQGGEVRVCDGSGFATG